ncbi:MAG: aquaporin, partial [Salinibacterium sp.]|nr:aquaporin [Salinibacterium sp.]
MGVQPRALLAEFLGTLILLAVIVGSGIAAERLSPGEVGPQLLESALVTALGLFAIIAVFLPISGAHFNPIVSVVDGVLGSRRWGSVLAYLPVQVAGAVAGTVLANLMFGLAPVALSTKDRLSWPTALAEVVATAGLVLVIFLLARSGRSALIAPAVAAWIGAAYFFTSSTSFANPAVAIGRMLSDTFAGIAPWSALGFIAAQVVGGLVGLVLVHALVSERSARLRRGDDENRTR